MNILELLPLIIGVGAVLVWMTLSQKKKDKKEKAMRDSIQVGDEIITHSGIIGIVVSVKDDTLMIETGNDRNKIRIKNWAIAKVETIHE